MNTSRTLSPRRIRIIKAQGYFHLTDAEVSALAFGNRFAYVLCASILATGVITAHIPTLLAMASVAFGTVVLPYHPFDYLYNHVVRHALNKPKLPARSKQLKFACSIATLWIAATIYLFYTGLTLEGYIMGGSLVFIATILVTTDLCIPSVIYNWMFTNSRMHMTGNLR